MWRKTKKSYQNRSKNHQKWSQHRSKNHQKWSLFGGGPPPRDPRGAQELPNGLGDDNRRPQVSETHIRGSPPGSTFGDHFRTKIEKKYEKWCRMSVLGRNRRMKRKKSEKWGHPGRAHMQSDCACAVETAFSGLRKRGQNASKMTSKMTHFGTFLTIFGSFCQKSAQK